MGNYLPVYKQIWTSAKFNKLKPNEKLIFLYLITSPMTHNTGIFYMLKKQIACDCDIEINEVTKALTVMNEIGLIRYVENENLFYIFNMFKFTRGTIKKPKLIYITTLRQEQLIQNHEVWQLFKENNLEFYEKLKEFEENETTKVIDDS